MHVRARKGGRGSKAFAMTGEDVLWSSRAVHGDDDLAQPKSLGEGAGRSDRDGEAAVQ